MQPRNLASKMRWDVWKHNTSPCSRFCVDISVNQVRSGGYAASDINPELIIQHNLFYLFFSFNFRKQKVGVYRSFALGRLGSRNHLG